MQEVKNAKVMQRIVLRVRFGLKMLILLSNIDSTISILSLMSGHVIRQVRVRRERKVSPQSLDRSRGPLDKSNTLVS